MIGEAGNARKDGLFAFICLVGQVSIMEPTCVLDDDFVQSPGKVFAIAWSQHPFLEADGHGGRVVGEAEWKESRWTGWCRRWLLTGGVGRRRRQEMTCSLDHWRAGAEDKYDGDSKKARGFVGI